MGLSLITFTIGTLVILFFTDVYFNWYDKFLNRVLPTQNMRLLMVKLMWVVLCLFFWLQFLVRRIPDNFDISYLLFAGFIYSIKGLILSFIRKHS